ncbi:MAG: glycine cleavage system aminomethyltransferase GcvT [Firmicutes bacterium]|jgi:aminomethyltransferase|nr:glycine cleavage system aminomethyltransferase GcvT [Bacillota bacterium]
MSELRKTPLYDAHAALGARLIDFGGWALPVQYTGILDEHKAVRERAGLFDVSHMGEIDVEGPDALRLVDHLVTNDCSGMSLHQVIYTPMCYPDGGVVDDLLVYKLAEDHYLLVVNASNTEKDFAWVQENLGSLNVHVRNISAETAQLALQGPRAEEILGALTRVDLRSIKFFFAVPDCPIADRKCLVSRTGYTGEDGFEIYCAPADAEHIWNALLDAGKPLGLSPAGLGARDTLRFEACLPLYGHELSPDISPLEANLGFFVKLGKDSFIGRDALLTQKERGLARKQVGLEILERGIPRQGYPVLAGDTVVGHVTSGAHSPTFNRGLALALVPVEHARAGTELAIDIRGRAHKAVVVKTPFYKKAYRKE